MDGELRQKFAPRKIKRQAHLRGFHEETKWVDNLDWKSNYRDFYLLTRSILDFLDSEYREKVGLRVDQLAEPARISDYFNNLRGWYRQEERP